MQEHEVSFSRPTNPTSFILKQVRFYSQVLLEVKPSHALHPEVYILWHPPPLDWVRVNTYGVSHSIGLAAGFGGVIRDSHGF